MYLSNGRAFKFWMTIYSGPALVPLVILVMFNFFVRDDLVDALGVKGSILSSRVSMALTVSFMVLLVLAHASAFWHQWRGLPLLPEAKDPN